ncbi:MAG: hypothetical protein Q7V57_13415 [Actinomycetota bacterium]|nr:hypothetical protein [Actinomycetota bacterium]
MRQFFTLRFWMSLVALVALVVAVGWLTAGSDDGAEVAVSDSILSSASPAPRRVDLVHWVTTVQAPGGVGVTEGLLDADLALLLDPTRTMVIKAGTPGEMSCPLWEQPGQCTVAARLLGDAVLWFALVPGPTATAIKLPGVVQVLDDNVVQLANGWLLRRVSVVERSCDDDTTSLRNFVDMFGDTATATFSFEQQKVVKVTCPRVRATTTTSTVLDLSSTIPTAPESLPEGTTTTEEPG